MGGTCSLSDNEAFGYSTPMALRPQIKALEDANLVVSSIDDTDKRRKTISVTPRHEAGSCNTPGLDTRRPTDDGGAGSRLLEPAAIAPVDLSRAQARAHDSDLRPDIDPRVASLMTELDAPRHPLPGARTPATPS